MKARYKYLLVIIGGLIVILTVVLATVFSTDKTLKKEVNMDNIMNTIFNTVQEIVEEQNEMFETPVNEQFDIQILWDMTDIPLEISLQFIRIKHAIMQWKGKKIF